MFCPEILKSKYSGKIPMKIYKESANEKGKGLLHFYALDPILFNGKVIVYEHSFGVLGDTFKRMLNASSAKKNKPDYEGEVLYVCFDSESGRIYLPDQKANSFFYTRRQIRPILSECYRILQEKYNVKDLKPQAVIKGDPLTTIRIKKIGNYNFAKNFIESHLDIGKEDKKILDIPVIEANLDLMPTTLAKVGINIADQGLYVGKLFGDSLSFILKPNHYSGQMNPVMVHSQETPFILVNTAPQAKVSESDKERIVVLQIQNSRIADGGKENFSAEDYFENSFNSLKYILYLGWSVKQICLYSLDDINIRDLQDLFIKGAAIEEAKAALEKTGYRQRVTTPFYYAMRINPEDFPFQIDFSKKDLQKFNPNSQPKLFQILSYDESSKMLAARSTLYIPEKTLQKVLHSSDVTIFEYDPSEKFLKTETPIAPLILSSRETISQINTDVFGARTENFRIRQKTSEDVYFDKCKVSDFFQAADYIKDICSQLNTPEEPVYFQDIDVIVGPWAKVTSIIGGYLSEKRCRDLNIPIPYEIIPNIKITPPCIILDASMYPSVADRAHILVHEYRHHINDSMGVESPKYDLPEQFGKLSREDQKKWLIYLNSPDERLAHISQIKYFISSGLGREQILRILLKDWAEYDNLPLAKKYDEFINIAQKELEEQDERRAEEKRVNEAFKKLTQQEMETSPSEYLSEGYFDRDALL